MAYVLSSVSNDRTILLVSNSAFNILHFRKSLWKALLHAGYRVVAVAPADGKEDILRKEGLHFVDLPHLQRFGSGPWKEYLLYQDLKKTYRQYRPLAVLHFTIKPNIYGSLAARHKATPSVATITGLGTTWLNGSWLRKLTELLYRYSLPAASVVVGQNAHDLEALQDIGVQAQSWQLIPGSGIDTADYRPGLSTPPTQTVNFLFLGRILIDKGIRELFNAWRQIYHLLPDAYLHLVGELDTTHPRCVAAQVWREGLQLPRVVYHGYQEEVRKHISDSQIVVLPSYREGIPRSLLEAMAMAKPIIATDVPGCRELALPRKTGWRVPARSSAALAEALLQAYRSKPSELQALGQQGRKLIQAGYSEEIVARQYLEILEELMR